MTHITVLVQHAWAMQPAGVAPAKPSEAEHSSSKGSPRAKIPRVRVSIPSTVGNFVYLFNLETHTAETRALLDAQALDILARLEDLALASSIRDPLRKDPMLEQSHAHKAKLFKTKPAPLVPKKSARIQTPFPNPAAPTSSSSSTLSSATSSRRYAAQARRSLLVLATCRSRTIRSRSMGLLMEALDTNELGSDDGEVAALLLLVKELGDVLESAIGARRARAAQLPKNESEAVASNNRNSDSIQALSVNVDEFLEKLAICISLSVQRLEYACDIKSFFIPAEVQESFHRLFNENLCFLQTSDPFIIQIITSSVETIHWLMTAKVESEELMATPVALSLLSQVIRMTPGLQIREMLEPFIGILNDLKEKQEWHLGCKFIRLLAAGTALNEECCEMFIELIAKLDADCWMWIYLSILCLGVTALTTESSTIRKLALEHGILRFIEQTSPTSHDTNSGDPSHAPKENAAESNNHADVHDPWRVRAAAATCLSALYQHNRSSAIGLLAHEALRERREVETNSHVRMLLTPSNSTHHPRRVSFLFKYICFSLAETHAELQSRYSFLKKFIRSTKRRSVPAEPKKFGYKLENQVKSLGQQSETSKAARHADTDKNSVFNWNTRVVNLPEIRPSKDTNETGQLPDPAELAAEAALSIAPYHQNYKAVRESEALTKKDLKPSNLSVYPYKTGHEVYGKDIVNPSNGTVNRRKLFNANSKNEAK
ncbi:hypothetical protein HDU78_002117 [Chytriomyces hyalinus]|nr:hypothetical protein HDU78_002117 [Chytriomyces hyalinus]